MCEYSIDNYRCHDYGYKSPSAMLEFVDYLDKYIFPEEKNIILVGHGNSSAFLGAAAILSQSSSRNYYYYDGVKHTSELIKDNNQNNFKLVFIDDCIHTGFTLSKICKQIYSLTKPVDKVKINAILVFNFISLDDFEVDYNNYVDDDCIIHDILSEGSQYFQEIIGEY